MTAGLAGMVGTTIIGPRIGFFRKRNPSKDSFDYARMQQEKHEEKVFKATKTRDQMLVEY